MFAATVRTIPGRTLSTASPAANEHRFTNSANHASREQPSGGVSASSRTTRSHASRGDSGDVGPLT
jgi:hypothetical protein